MAINIDRAEAPLSRLRQLLNDARIDGDNAAILDALDAVDGELHVREEDPFDGVIDGEEDARKAIAYAFDLVKQARIIFDMAEAEVELDLKSKALWRALGVADDLRFLIQIER